QQTEPNNSRQAERRAAPLSSHASQPPKSEVFCGSDLIRRLPAEIKYKHRFRPEVFFFDNLFNCTFTRDTAFCYISRSDSAKNLFACNSACASARRPKALPWRFLAPHWLRKAHRLTTPTVYLKT